MDGELTEHRLGAHEITAIVNRIPLLRTRIKPGRREICVPRRRKYENKHANNVIGRLSRLIQLVTSRVQRH